LLTVATIFVYYSIWTLILVLSTQPLVDYSSPIHAWFPAREWAVRIPVFILILGMSAIGLFVGSKIVHD
ncbi:dolichol phosphate-mannose biosynthesis regulatory protein Dpm2, partial [Irpex lacteus]